MVFIEGLFGTGGFATQQEETAADQVLDGRKVDGGLVLGVGEGGGFDGL